MTCHHLFNSSNASSSSSWSYDADTDECEREPYLFYAVDGIRIRVVWVTNYMTNENFPIDVPADDPVVRHTSASSSATELKSTLSDHKDDLSLLNKIRGIDLTTLNLDDLLLLLHRLQQKTAQSSVAASASTISSSSGSTECTPSFGVPCREPTTRLLRPSLCSTVRSSLSVANGTPFPSPAIYRRKSSFALSNIADVPKQLTTTLAKPVSSFHSHNVKHAHSPNDVVNKLLQSFNTHNSAHHQKLIEYRSQRYAPSCTYQESQHHKAKLLSNLLSAHSIGRCPNGAYRNDSSY